MTTQKKSELTKKRIMDTYISLLEKKPYDKITVLEIAKAANIQRSTFYLYFENSYELLIYIENDLINKMNFYKAPENYDPYNVTPLPSIENWFAYCKENYKYIKNLMSVNGDAYFEKMLRDKICTEINQMMDNEGMPNDDLRPYCVELTYAIHFSLMRFALQTEGTDISMSAHKLACLSNHWRSSAISAENGNGLPIT